MTKSSTRNIDARAAAEWYAAATAFIQQLRKDYGVDRQAEDLDTVRLVEPDELAQATQEWAALEHRRDQIGLTAGRWLHDLKRHERLAPPTFLPANTIRATLRQESGWTYVQKLKLEERALDETAKVWLEEHGATCEPLYTRDNQGEIVAWKVLLPGTISCRVRTGIGHRIHAYLEDGSTLRCRAGSLTLAPAGCDVAMARPRKTRTDAIDWAGADMIIESAYLWVNDP